MPVRDDSEIIKYFRTPDKKDYAFRLLVEKYQERLYWHIRKIVIDHEDTDDVLQNTFIKIWKGFDGYREDSKLFTWLYRIATNEALTFLKQKKNRQTTSWDEVENWMAENLEADQFFNGNEIQKKLQKAVLTLPEKQRIVFNLKYFEEMKYEDMAAILNTSVGALKASYHHAVKKIESCFSDD